MTDTQPALPIVVTIVKLDGKPFSRYYPDYNDLTNRRLVGKFVTNAICDGLKVITAPFDNENRVHQVLRRKYENYIQSKETT